ncbi:MAG: DUF3572 domain-containing protein [Pseudomonadota bacterium]
MKQDWAEALALQALTYIAAESMLYWRFLDLTGMDPADVRASVTDTAFLGAVLDFLLGHEPSLLEFCTAADIDPQHPARARVLLLGDAAPDWS